MNSLSTVSLSLIHIIFQSDISDLLNKNQSQWYDNHLGVVKIVTYSNDYSLGKEL